jgi:peroxisomal 2,4-dienoyl-CoA reductase
VNGIAPGPIRDTVGMDRLGPLSAGAESPIRMGEKAEIALVAVFLCTEAANYINGENVVVDGGHWMLRPTMPKEIYHRVVRGAKL